MAYRVGSLRASDAYVLGPLQNRLWVETYAGLLPDEVLAARDDAENIRRWFDRGASHERHGIGPGGAKTWVARDEAAVPVGWLSVGPGRDEDAPAAVEVWSLYVAPEHQGTGVGRQLLQYLPSGQSTYLWVLPGNVRAVDFYRARGFVVDGATKYFGESDVLEIRMVRAGHDTNR